MLTGIPDKNAVQASSANENKIFDYIIRNPHEFNPNAPKTNWDFDWDKRDPASLIPPLKTKLKYDGDSKKQAQQDQPKSTATRHLLLIRHGQYNLNGATDEEKVLTDIVSV